MGNILSCSKLFGKKIEKKSSTIPKFHNTPTYFIPLIQDSSFNSLNIDFTPLSEHYTKT